MANSKADAIVVGGGIAGLVAAAELADAGKSVLLLDQENENNLGGQAFWSFGGLFFVDSPEQRRLNIHDSRELAMRDWDTSAAFDRPSDEWGRKWAEAYIDFAAGEKREWLHAQGMRWFPAVGWAERGEPPAPAWLWQQRAALSRDLGHRPGSHRSIRQARDGAPEERPHRAQVSTRRSRARHQPGRRHRCAGRGPRGLDRCPRRRQLTCRHRQLRAQRADGARDVGRHRRQPRAGEKVLADRSPRARARVHGRRSSQARRRCDAGGRPCCGGQPHQPRSHVALHRGHSELEPHLGEPRHSNLAGPQQHVARPDGKAVAVPPHSRARVCTTRCSTSPRTVSRTRGSS